MPVTPETCLLGPLNCIAAVGLPWRRVREIAIREGLPRVRAGRTTLVPLAEFRAALERERASEGTPVDAAEQTRVALGLRRRLVR